jgi:hypothetical protein
MLRSIEDSHIPVFASSVKLGSFSLEGVDCVSCSNRPNDVHRGTDVQQMDYSIEIAYSQMMG